MKYFALLLAFLTIQAASAQQMLQEVIVDYVNIVPQNIVNKVIAKNKPIKVVLPKGATLALYRITVFQPEKVNTYTRLYETVRLVNPDTLAKEGYNFDKHLLEANGNFNVAMRVFKEEKEANNYLEGKEASACFEIDSTQSKVGILKGCGEETVFVAIKPLEKKKLGSIKVELVALADVVEDPINDRFPFSIQNELSGEIVYEVSGDRMNWQAFYLPSKKKAEFKLADSQVYVRVSTLDKVTEEYKIDSGKKYRFYWNKDTNRFDLGEIPKK
ncbi:MAG: hypothetical protein R2822_19490 [Spirosomataceae bacterium]